MIAQVTGIIPGQAKNGKSYWKVTIGTGQTFNVWNPNFMNIIKLGSQLDWNLQTNEKGFIDVIGVGQVGQLQPALPQPQTQVQPNTGAIPPENYPPGYVNPTDPGTVAPQSVDVTQPTPEELAAANEAIVGEDVQAQIRRSTALYNAQQYIVGMQASMKDPDQDDVIRIAMLFEKYLHTGENPTEVIKKK